MPLREHTEYLVGKRLADAIHAGEVEDDGLEQFHPRKKSFGLRPRNQIVVAVARQAYRNDGLVESIIIAGRILIENFARSPRSMVVKFHPYTRPGLKSLPFKYPVICLSKNMIEENATGQNIELVE